MGNSETFMAFELQKVVPWGRSFEEYVAMFSLSKKDLTKRILGCGDGPSCFNAEMNKRGNNCTSVDPIYHFSIQDLRKRIEESYELVLEQVRKNKREFVWKNIKTIEDLGKIRKGAMAQFLSDFEQGKSDNRYMVGELPTLQFANNEFDLAICSHFLFLYSSHFSLTFHVDSIKELCRVAKEVRIFPLLELGTKTSRHLEQVIKIFGDNHYNIEIRTVQYEFQKGGNKLLVINDKTNA